MPLTEVTPSPSPALPLPPALPEAAVHLLADPALGSSAAFLRAVAEARQHLATGARQIVFVIPAHLPGAERLYHSLASFARHAVRVCPEGRARLSAILMPHAPARLA